MKTATRKRASAKPALPSPYLISIPDREVMISHSNDMAIAQAMRREGFDLGLMPLIGAEEQSPTQRKEMWDTAMAHAGIRQIDTWRDERAASTMVRVWRKEFAESP